MKEREKKKERKRERKKKVTRPDTRLPGSRAGGQGLQTPSPPKKIVTDGWINRWMDRQTRMDGQMN